MEEKLTRYFNCRKINKYLKSKKSEYKNLDLVLKGYVDGTLQKHLHNYNFNKIEYYLQIYKRGNYLQVDFGYFNLHINIEFDDDSLDYVIYLPGISAEDFDKSVVTKNYCEEFTIEKFFEDFYNMLQQDNRLRK